MNGLASSEITKLFICHKQIVYITRKVSHNPSVIQLPLPETLKMAESQKSDSQEWKKPKLKNLKLKKAQKKKQNYIPIMNMDEKKQVDSNTNEQETPIVFQMKFGAPFCIILLLIFFIQRLSMILT